MNLYTKTILRLEDKDLCESVIQALAQNYNKELIKRRFNISKRQLERILEQHEKKANIKPIK